MSAVLLSPDDGHVHQAASTAMACHGKGFTLIVYETGRSPTVSPLYTVALKLRLALQMHVQCLGKCVRLKP